MTDTNLTKAWWPTKLLRGIIIAIDIAVFSCLYIVYQLFFLTASAKIFHGDTISKFYHRIQLIIGVYMIFVLAVTVLRGIVNPDEFFSGGKGSSGTGAKLIMRIVTALTIFALLMPVNIPKSENTMTNFEKSLKENGVIFGVLYSLQERILSNNVIGKLILGDQSDFGDISDDSVESNDGPLARAGRQFVNGIVISFYSPNLVPADKRSGTPSDSNYKINNSMCRDYTSTDYYKYLKANDWDYEKIEPGKLLWYGNTDCNSKTDVGAPGKVFVLNALPVISTIVAAFIFVVFLSITVDVAIRAIKLEILKLIAPIPVISYMDPKGSKDSAFNAWVKLLTTTYLDLFIRVASIYLSIFVIRELFKSRMETYSASFLNAFVWILLVIGLFFFAKEAPKFIKQAMGIKDEGSGSLFGGLAKVAAAGAVVGGVFGSAAANWRAAHEESKALYQNGKNPFTRGVKKTYGALRTGVSTLAGGASGVIVGGKAALGKDGNAKSVLAAQMQRNATRAAHSTAPGRFLDNVVSNITGRSPADSGNEKLKVNQEAFKTLKDYKTTLEDEALKKTDFYGTNARGQQFNYSKLSAAVQRARSSGSATFDYDDGHIRHTNLRTDMFDDNEMNAIKSSQAEAYSYRLMNDASFREAEGTANNAYLLARKAASDADISFNGRYATTKKAMGRAKDAATEAETDMRQIMRRANKQQKK